MIEQCIEMTHCTLQYIGEGDDSYVQSGTYSVCQVCKKNSLRFFREHHCRQCGKVWNIATC